MRVFSNILCTSLFLLASLPVATQPFAYLDEKSMENLEVTRERIFEGSGLFGFMNGGAELFLEYGFRQLLEQRITYQGVPFVAEYYFMDNQEHAYGIYSVHAFKCRRADERFPIECLIPGLLQFYHGHLYISLKCLDRTIDSQPLLDALATIIISKNPITGDEKTVPLHAYPPPHSGTLYFVCGDLGLSSAYIGWAKFFITFQDYAMWLRIDPETQKASAQVRFVSVDDTNTFCIQNENQLDISRLSAIEIRIIAK